MTSDTPESSSPEQPAVFTSRAPESWSQPTADSWAATEATQEPQLPEPDPTPTSPWPQLGQPTPSGQIPPGSLQPGQYPPGPFQPGQYPTGQYPTGQHQPGQYPPGPFQPGQYPVGQYPAGPFGYPPQFYVPVMARNNPFAITALVCGLVQFVLGLAIVGNIVAAVPAIVFGSIALKQIRLRGERGRGMAIAGLVLGIAGVLYFALIIVLIVIGAHTGNSG